MTQQKLIRENFGIEGKVIRSCAPDYSRCSSGTSVKSSAHRTRLLWIGRFSPEKRLELLLEIAEKHRDMQFDVIGDGNAESEYVRRLRSRAMAVPNVRLHGRVPHADVQEFYRRAVALVCTSHYEGFPNVFLEAWSHGLPVVSTFDPDGLIAERGLGVFAEGITGLIKGIRVMRRSQQHWNKVSRAALQYYRHNHSIEAVMPRIESTFLSLANRTET
jgi:glycosyltransferase involved in cell wall biosynthesis